MKIILYVVRTPLTQQQSINNKLGLMLGHVPLRYLAYVSQSGLCKILKELMLLLLFVAVMDNGHMVMDCFTSVVFCQLRVSIRDRSNLKTKNENRKRSRKQLHRGNLVSSIQKSEAMCQFFDNRDYPVFVVLSGHHCAQQIDRQTALQKAERQNTYRIPFTIKFQPDNYAVKFIILKKL